MGSSYRVIVRQYVVVVGLRYWRWVCEHCGAMGSGLTTHPGAVRSGLAHLAEHHSLSATLRTYYAGVTAAALAARAREDDDDPWGEHDDVNGLHRLDAPKSCVCATEAGVRPESCRGCVPPVNGSQDAAHGFLVAKGGRVMGPPQPFEVGDDVTFYSLGPVIPALRHDEVLISEDQIRAAAERIKARDAAQREQELRAYLAADKDEQEDK